MSSRSRPAGLPTGPSPRARSRSRPRQEEYSRSDRESARSLRSQKSTPSFSRESARLRVAEPRRTPRSPPSNNPEGGHRRSDDSTSSMSSGASSLFDRMKSSAASYASSLTSAEDDEDGEKSSSLRNRRLARAERRSQDAPVNTDSTGTGDGFTIWSRVASAASTLTVSVSKAWTTNIATYAGEETPPGQESRLTRAMKAYHIEKARDPTDLPAWLFEEHERQPLQRAQRARRNVEEQESVVAITEKSNRPRGLRDVYDSVSRSDQPSTSTGPTTTRGTDRLKALREAKRSAVLDQPTPPRAEPVQESRRVGLPSGPSRRR